MKDSSAKLIAYLIILAIFLVPLSAYQLGTKDTVTVIITGKERVATGSGDSLSHKYLVFTEHETFQNTDALFHLKYSSSDIQGKLRDGRAYDLEVYGWRIPFLSMYRNIISAKPATEEPKHEKA